MGNAFLCNVVLVQNLYCEDVAFPDSSNPCQLTSPDVSRVLCFELLLWGAGGAYHSPALVHRGPLGLLPDGSLSESTLGLSTATHCHNPVLLPQT